MKDWTEELKERLADHTVEPPQDLWGDIEAALDQQAKPVKRTLRPAWWWAVAACGLLLIGLSLPLMKEQLTAPVVASNQPVLSGNAPEVPLVQEETAEIDAPQTAAVLQPVAKPQLAVATPVTPQIKKVETVAPDTAAVAPVQEQTAKAENRVAEATPQLTVEEAEALLQDLLAQQEAEEFVPEEKHKRLALNFFAGNIPTPDLGGGELYDNNYNDMLFSPGEGEYNYGEGGKPNNTDKPNNPNQNQTRAAAFPAGAPKLLSARHKRPIKVGVSLSYPLTERLSVDAGLMLSLHSSYMSYQDGGWTYNFNQTLRYVGIPVGVRYRLYDLKPVSIYLTAGGAVEQCVYGKGESAYDDIRLPYSIASTLKERRPQFSLSGGGGVQVALSRLLAVYVEPSLTYYIDNHSGLNNIYKDKPLNLDVRVGLRFNLK